MHTKKRFSRILLPLYVALCLSVSAVWAQDKKEDYKPVTLDLAVPESPAAAALAGNYELVLKPSTAREFTSSLIGLRDEKGGIAPGVSIEATPAFFSHGMILPASYKKDSLLRATLNTQVSLATGNRDATTGKVQRIAAGVRIPLIDDGDPRHDINGVFSKCIREQIQAPVIPIPVEPGETTTPLSDNDKKAIEVCKTQFKHATWNARALILGLAQVWSDSGKTDTKLQRDTRYIWLSYSMPFGTELLLQSKKDNGLVDIKTVPGQFIVQLRHVSNGVADGKESIEERTYDSRAAAVRIRYGRESFNLSLAGSAERRQYDHTGAKENVRVITGGLERKLPWKDTWLRLSIGNERRGGTTDTPFAFMNFAWSKEAEPIFQTPPFKAAGQ